MAVTSTSELTSTRRYPHLAKFQTSLPEIESSDLELSLGITRHYPETHQTASVSDELRGSD
eukprot:4656955-Pyramimonas_sp.AAC.1